LGLISDLLRFLWYLIGIFNENILKNIFLSHKPSTFDFPTIIMIAEFQAMLRYSKSLATTNHLSSA